MDKMQLRGKGKMLMCLLNALVVLLLNLGSANAQKFKIIQSFTAANCGECLLAKAGQKYTFKPNEINSSVLGRDAAERNVYFNTRMSFPFYVEDIKSDYQIRITYLSDSRDRVIKVLADQQVLNAGLRLPYGKPLTETYDIPRESYKDGSFVLALIPASGANVAISGLEILSTGNKAPVYKNLLTEKLNAFTFSPSRLSPKPAKVAGVKNPVMLLNGTWDFKYKTQQGKIQVPGEWAMQGYQVDSAQQASYHTSFEMPKDWNGKSIKIRFDGVSSFCQVYLNDALIGEHEGGFVAFEMNATKAVKAGNNKLEVKVASQTISDKIGCVSQYAAHTVGGILRKVSVMALPQINIGSVNPVVKFDGEFKDATVDVQYQIFNESASAADAALKFILLDKDGKEVVLNQGQTAKASIKNKADIKGVLKLNVPLPKQWDTEHPYLYTLVTQLTSKGQVIQESRQKLGFRQIDIRGNQFFVNNKPIKLHGANRHDVGALSGRSVSAEVNLADVIAFRNANCNYIRTSHYPPAEELLAACDSLGLFVEAEAAITWVEHNSSPIWKQWDYLNPDFLPYFVRANIENIQTNRNHPSIIIWSIANESRWSPLWEKVNSVVKQFDPTRPTAFHDQTYGGFNNAGSMADIRNIHYPGLGGPQATDQFKDRPVLFGEYCHVQTYNRLEEVTDPYIRADWGRMLQQMYDRMYVHEACLGGAIWAGIDDIFHMPDSSIVGYGPWGSILDAWRREKPEFIAVRKSYAPFIVTNLKTAKPVNGVLSLNIQNRYDFANLNEGVVRYVINGKTQTASANIPARSEGVLSLNIPDQTDSLMITYTDPRGFVTQEELLIFKQPKTEIATSKKQAVKLKSSANEVVVSAGDKKYAFNKMTGALANEALLSSLNLMVVPMNGYDGGAPHIAGNNYQRNIQPILNQPEAGWKASTVSGKMQNDTAVVTVEGSYSQFQGKYVYLFPGDGTVQVEYSFKMTAGNGINPRQWGLALELPGDFQHLNYSSKGFFSVYPETDIARTKGDIYANPVHLKYVEAPRSVPKGPWAADANDLGSRDFRSTKANIYHATLSNDKGSAVTVLSDGKQSARSWIDGNKTRFLIAELNGGGSDSFFAGYYSRERKPLKMGSELKGVVKFKVD
ncbi:glycoside hydrolase family 2 protein [Pedobacter frigoris]|uniref:glycoside hydrolase family 2 protein n=1 Tax=Pedobacter frigoris TaxID=2571272 RepID=UPI00292E680C|nr:glycoside hydrolase family 2 TIM barrel-domain containing protein [Pedobacter frigoris]